ncbi:MAG: hypothetical protein Q8P18_11450 [Pseudomonadota bacterium]|nr:hypothetical protein [Pseudomonadota bacterium]
MTILALLLACTGEPGDTGLLDTCSQTSGTICLYAGTGDAGYDPDEKHRLETWLYFPMDIEVREGKPTIILDWNNNSVRQVTPSETVVLAVGTGYAGDGPPDYSDNDPGGAPGTSTAMNHPTDAIWQADGELLIAAWHNHKLRRWNPDTGLVHILGGGVTGFAGDGGPVVDALFSQPHSVVAAEDGSIYLTDMRNGRVRVVAPDLTISTLGGDGTQGFAGDGGPVSGAVFNFPTGATPRPGAGLALDGDTLYVSDSLNHRVRAVNLATGMIDTVVGTGIAGSSGDGGPAVDAQLNSPIDIEIGGGKLYIADTDNSRIRVVDLASGTISTLVGTGESSWSGDDGPAVDAALNFPHGICLVEDGRLFIADTYNHMIRVVYP